MAAREDKPVHRVDIAELQKILLDQGQVLSLRDNIYGAFNYRDEIIIDNNMKRFTGKTGSWWGNELEHNGRYQMNYAQNDNGKGTFSFKPWIEKSGWYELSIRHPAKKSYAEAVRIGILHRDGQVEKIVNQQENPGDWIILGNYQLDSGYREIVTIVADGTRGTVVADAVKLRLIR
jgi:hypothetical protein